LLDGFDAENVETLFQNARVQSQSVKCDSRTAPFAQSARQLFRQRRFKFVQRAFGLREIALEPQRFTKFSAASIGLYQAAPAPRPVPNEPWD